jgi:hypothetical protein
MNVVRSEGGCSFLRQMGLVVGRSELAGVENRGRHPVLASTDGGGTGEIRGRKGRIEAGGYSFLRQMGGGGEFGENK